MKINSSKYQPVKLILAGLVLGYGNLMHAGVLDHIVVEPYNIEIWDDSQWIDYNHINDIPIASNERTRLYRVSSPKVTDTQPNPPSPPSWTPIKKVCYWAVHESGVSNPSNGSTICQTFSIAGITKQINVTVGTLEGNWYIRAKLYDNSDNLIYAYDDHSYDYHVNYVAP